MKARASTRLRAKPRRAFPARVLALLRASRILRIRAGADHRFTGIWFVMVGDRVFVRPWFDNLTGWRRAFQKDPRGAVTVGKREIPIRARTARGSGLFDKVDAAYASKYNTAASLKWVRGFHKTRRRKTTTELRPRGRECPQPWSRRRKSPEVTEGGGLRRGSERARERRKYGYAVFTTPAAARPRPNFDRVKKVVPSPGRGARSLREVTERRRLAPRELRAER
jgi:hypothetical protein